MTVTAGTFLISKPLMSRTPGIWYNSVVFVYENNTSGTGGLIINKKSGRHLQDLVVQYGYDYPQGVDPIHIGGPVAPGSVMMMHTEDFVSNNTLTTGTGINISSDDLMIEKIVHGAKPNGFKLCAGIASWLPGQLQLEIERQQWLTTTSLPHSLVFDSSGDKLWQQALEHCGSQLFNHYF